MSASTFRISLLIAVFLLAPQSTQRSLAQVAEQQGNSPPYYTLLTPGMLASPAFPYAFAAGKFRVEARNLIMGHAKASEVPVPTDMLMELRAGALTTTIDGKAQERIEGDFWTVAKGSHLDVENKGQVAVIRTVYVYPGGK